MNLVICFILIEISTGLESVLGVDLAGFSELNNIIDHLKKAEETVKIGKEPASAIIKRDGKGLSYLTRFNNLVGLPSNNYGILTVDGSVSTHGDASAELTLDAYTLFGTPRIHLRGETDSCGNFFNLIGVKFGGRSDDSLRGELTIGGDQYLLTTLDASAGYGPASLSLNVFRDVVSWSGDVDLGVASLIVGVNGDGTLAKLEVRVENGAFRAEAFANISAGMPIIHVHTFFSLGAYPTIQLNLTVQLHPEIAGTLNLGSLSLQFWSAPLTGDFRVGGSCATNGVEINVTSENFRNVWKMWT